MVNGSAMPTVLIISDLILLYIFVYLKALKIFIYFIFILFSTEMSEFANK